MKKVLAIHDLSGFGRCSLTVAVPVISAMGIQCCPMPTALLSTHTGGFQGFTFHDLTGEMTKILEHYKELDLEFDAIYSGFLGSLEQTCVVSEIIRELKKERTLVLIDPVMGDNGKPYSTYTPEMCEGMGRLVKSADILTPNLTEAAILLGVSYAEAPRSESGVKEWLSILSDGDARSVVITGLHSSGGETGHGYFDHTVELEGGIGCGYFDHTVNEFGFLYRPRVKASYPGTGDLFASVLLGSLLRGSTLREAVATAAGFVHDCCEATYVNKTPAREGVAFEPLLKTL